MPATTAHQQLQVEQQVSTDDLGFETPVVDITPDLTWLLTRLLEACNADHELWHLIRTAKYIDGPTGATDSPRAKVIATAVARSSLVTAWTMVETVEEAAQLRDDLDEATEIGSCGHDSCVSPALHGNEFCGAHLDGVDEFRIGA